VDALFDTAAAARHHGPNNRPLKSLSERSRASRAVPPEPARQARGLFRPLVIVVGRTSSCTSAAAEKMALELFSRSSCASSRSAHRLVDQGRQEVRGEEAARGVGHPRRRHPRDPVLAETARRRSTGSVSRPSTILVEARPSRSTPRLHGVQTPTSTGDQMAVHVPLSNGGAAGGAGADAVSNNILSPSNGRRSPCPRRTWSSASTT